MLATTGHRPGVIASALGRQRFNRDDALELVRFARRKVIKANPDKMAIGMALGWDQAVALACVSLTIPFRAYIPFDGQEALWPGSEQIIYRELLNKAETVIVVCDYKLDIAFQKRNELMIDDSESLMAFYSGARGGTHNCVEYARGWVMDIENHWPEWAARYV